VLRPLYESSKVVAQKMTIAVSLLLLMRSIGIYFSICLDQWCYCELSESITTILSLLSTMPLTVLVMSA